MASAKSIQYASLTDVGIRRSHNQDACAAQPAADDSHWSQHGHVFIVADGMGGHAVGEKASAKAVRDIPLTYLKHVSQEGPASAIKRAFIEGNAAIFAIGQNNPEFKGLGTTATALFVRDDGVWVGHVGDSRAYRIRGGKVQQLTFDHSWVWEVARRQGVDPDELGDFKRNVIIRSLGPDSEVEVDLEGPHPVQAGDTFLLCSDGLSNLVTAEEMGAITATFPPEEACEHLVSLANVRGGPDNITCLIVHVPAGDVNRTAFDLSILPSGVTRLGSALNRLVPWPFLALFVGALVIGLSLWMRQNELKTIAVALFVLASATIFSGLIGLYFHMRNRSQDHHDEHTPTELHVYRENEFKINQDLVEKYRQLDQQLVSTLKENGGMANWDEHDRLIAEADSAGQNKNWQGAFRSLFLGVQQLIRVLNSGHRGSGESFQPNWTAKG